MKMYHTYVAKGVSGRIVDTIDKNKMSKGLLLHYATNLATIPVNNWYLIYLDLNDGTPFRESTMDTISSLSTLIDYDEFCNKVKNGELK